MYFPRDKIPQTFSLAKVHKSGSNHLGGRIMSLTASTAGKAIQTAMETARLTGFFIVLFLVAV